MAVRRRIQAVVPESPRVLRVDLDQPWALLDELCAINPCAIQKATDADVVVDRFRRELNTDYLDLVQLHCMVAPDWTERERRQMDLLDDLKGRGVIKAHGVSVHTWEAMKAPPHRSGSRSR